MWMRLADIEYETVESEKVKVAILKMENARRAGMQVHQRVTLDAQM